MSRRVARELLFKLVFEFTFNKTYSEDSLSLSLLDATLDDDSRAFIKVGYKGIINQFGTLCTTIEQHSKGFELSRLYKPDFVALLIGVYELLFCDDIPYKVVINEAVALAKIYGEEKSPQFVNGVLASVLKERENNK